MPGGAAGAGLYAVVFGTGFFLSSRRWPVRLLGMVSMGLGLFCIYVCQVRSTLIVAGVCVLVFALVLLVRGEMKRFLSLLVVIPPLVLGTAVWTAWRIARRSARGSLELWAALILAYDIGAIASTFGYPLFIGQGGMEFWLLNTALFGAAVYQAQAVAPARRAAGPGRAAAPP